MRMRLQKIPRRMARQSTPSSPLVTSSLHWPDWPGQQQATQNWKAKAMADYSRTADDRELLLRLRLTRRAQALTGCVPGAGGHRSRLRDVAGGGSGGRRDLPPQRA